MNMSLFATNDELFAKLRAGNPGFDVIVPGNEFVERMIQADLLEPLDHAKIPNIKNVAPEFINDAPYDPGRKYRMPYTWLVIGIGYRKSKVKERSRQLEVAVRFRRVQGPHRRHVGRERAVPQLPSNISAIPSTTPRRN